MIRPRWTTLHEHERAAFRAVLVFLARRLDEPATLDWALRLGPDETIKRLAVLELIDGPDTQKVGEPWRSAWRLVEESWKHPAVEHASVDAYHVQRRLRAGDRSGSVIAAIVDLVRPRLKVEPFSGLHLQHAKPPARPKKIADIFSTRLTSGKEVDPRVFELEKLTDRAFLISLANSLEGAVANGLDIARRIGWDGEKRYWQLGQLHRVYFVPPAERPAGGNEPDQFHPGIAPSVKLLYGVVEQLVEVDVTAAIAFAHRWKLLDPYVYFRLWAALSRDPRITSANEIGAFLTALDDAHFWRLHDFPEIAQLRAIRFNELDSVQQSAILARIRKRPPRKLWPKTAKSEHVEDAQSYWAARELRRIEVGGGTLRQSDKDWLDSIAEKFPDLAQIARTDEGFPESAKVGWVKANPDNRYDLIAGAERLSALETALSSTRSGWDDDPARRATDWIREKGNSCKILADFESDPDGGAAFPQVWEQFGWTHIPSPEQVEGEGEPNSAAEAARVLALLSKLPSATVRSSIEGISQWLSAWENQIVALPDSPTIWQKLWPIAVEATNARQPDENDTSLNKVVRSSGDDEPIDLDTLNTPAGKLVGVFLRLCPTLEGPIQPFEDGNALRSMRDAIIGVTGQSNLIARHRLIEWLPYFLRADRDWTQTHLVAPLIAETVDALALWRAIARQTRFSEVLKIIGGPMTERAVDRRLGRATRQSLVFSLVVECLYAFKEARDPAVPYPRIQQMLRSLDDEVRAYGAEAIWRFVVDKAENDPAGGISEELFQSAVAPFLKQVWPQERSLTTPGISRELAKLPAATQGAFADAVSTIERFLVPFECWSMFEYGFHEKQDGESNLSTIDTAEKAGALLQLLDRTIGTSETSVIPHGLPAALDQIRKISSTLAGTPVFRRLATAARR